MSGVVPEMPEQTRLRVDEPLEPLPIVALVPHQVEEHTRSRSPVRVPMTTPPMGVRPMVCPSDLHRGRRPGSRRCRGAQ